MENGGYVVVRRLRRRIKSRSRFGVNLNNLGALQYAKGNATKAEQLYRRALAIKEKVLGRDHPDVAMTLNNLAVLYKSQGRFTEAEPLYRRSLSIFQKVLGPSHPKVVTCLKNYAALLRIIRQKGLTHSS